MTNTRIPQLRQNKCCITPQNAALLELFFEFLANASYAQADLYLRELVQCLLIICFHYEFQGYQPCADSVRIQMLARLSNHLHRMLLNKNITQPTKDIVLNFLFHNRHKNGLTNLVASAATNKINDQTELGREKLSLLATLMPLCELMPEAQRQRILQMIIGQTTPLQVKGEQVNFYGKEKVAQSARLDVKMLLKLPHKNTLILILGFLLKTRDFQSSPEEKKDEILINDQAQSRLSFDSKLDPGHKDMFIKAHSEKNVIQVSAAGELMSHCLKALELYFNGQKAFSSLAPYLQLIFKIFACIEPCEAFANELSGRTAAEFTIYFVTTAINHDQIVNFDLSQLQIFIDMYVECIRTYMQSVKGETNQDLVKSSQQHNMLHDAFEVLCSFVPIFRGLSKKYSGIIEA